MFCGLLATVRVYQRVAREESARNLSLAFCARSATKVTDVVALAGGDVVGERVCFTIC